MPSDSRKAAQCPAVRKTVGEIRVPEHTATFSPSSSATSAPTLGWPFPSGTPKVIATAGAPKNRSRNELDATILRLLHMAFFLPLENDCPKKTDIDFLPRRPKTKSKFFVTLPLFALPTRALYLRLAIDTHLIDSC